MDTNSEQPMQSLKFNRRYPHLPFGYTPAGHREISFDDPDMPVITDLEFQRDVKDFEKLEEQITAVYQVYEYLQDLQDRQRTELTTRATAFWDAEKVDDATPSSSTSTPKDDEGDEFPAPRSKNYLRVLYTLEEEFNVPDDLDLKDETQVVQWKVQSRELYIKKVDGSELIISPREGLEDMNFKHPTEVTFEVEEDDV